MRSNQDFAQSSGVNFDKDSSFYNTINLQGSNLVKAKKQAESQESKILAFLQANKEQSFTKQEIKTALVNLGKIGGNTPESSISRALSNLHKEDKVLKLQEMRLGEFEKPNHLWQAVPEPLPIGTQVEMFK
jgi:hypothetical protein